ncbi:MAG: M50 family metallopeptidase [Chloroflexota bacterium]
MTKSVEDLLKEINAGPAGSGALPQGQGAVAKSGTGRMATRSGRLARMPIIMVAIAAIIAAVIGSLPFGSYVLYPFALFVTQIHETGHALAAVLTGGTVDSIQIQSNLAGLTTTRGGIQAVVASAGYLGATVAGVALLLTPIRFSRWILGAAASIPIIDLVFFHPADSFTAIWSVVFALGLGLAAWKLPARMAAFLQIFLGVEAGLNAFRDAMTLVFISGSNAHIHTDATNMSQALFLPATFWAVTWTVISLVLLIGAMLRLVRRDLASLKS